ncbi:hypothetical protein IWX90DRAFT_437861 [Phyllosticta citrichinensis]|uniref:Uncharacterized protein n=1 Tax=Phyllosticta citrichinensis TaxID=1130410 RepID=A0ABR1XMS5_9PEZI
MPRLSDKKNRRRYRAINKSLASFPNNPSGEEASSQNQHLLDLSAEPFQFAPDLAIPKHHRENKFSLLDRIDPDESCNSCPNSQGGREDAWCEEGKNQIQSQEIHRKTGPVVQEGSHEGQDGSCRCSHEATEQSLNKVVVEPRQISLANSSDSSMLDWDHDAIARGETVGQRRGFTFGLRKDGSERNFASPQEELRHNSSFDHQHKFPSFSLGTPAPSSIYKNAPQALFACQKFHVHGDTDRDTPAAQPSQRPCPANLGAPSTVFHTPSTTQTTTHAASAVKMSENAGEQDPPVGPVRTPVFPGSSMSEFRPHIPPPTLPRFRRLPPPHPSVCRAWDANEDIYQAWDNLQISNPRLHDIFCDDSRWKLYPAWKYEHLYQVLRNLRIPSQEATSYGANTLPGLGAAMSDMEQPMPAQRPSAMLTHGDDDQDDNDHHATSETQKDDSSRAGSNASENGSNARPDQGQPLNNQASDVAGESPVPSAEGNRDDDNMEETEKMIEGFVLLELDPEDKV